MIDKLLPRSLVLIALGANAGIAFAQNLPRYEIIPWLRIVGISATDHEQWSAIKVDRKSGTLSQCTVGLPLERPLKLHGKCYLFQPQSGSIDTTNSTVKGPIAKDQPESGGSFGGTRELWSIDISTGKVTFCAFVGLSQCIELDE